ncbi:hypothetical protein [Rhodococcus kronopolitis]|uniref:Uncharacterized protein n=1 Tax=Rhodococcus kronopolitis TaxID=1460226 RepID=A0ABV9FMH4_9NOCA
MVERGLTVSDRGDRENLATFVARAVRLDEALVVRLRQRGTDRVEAWATTGFDALASRVVAGTVAPTDTTAAGDALLATLTASPGAEVELGFSMDSAWQGALPPVDGFVHVDDVPARVLVELAQQGVAVSRDFGSSQGPPASLLAQEVLTVDGAGERVAVSMRTVFALVAMGFIPQTGTEPVSLDADLARIDATEMVRVRASRTWLRLDARFGSVFARRGGEIPLSVL